MRRACASPSAACVGAPLESVRAERSAPRGGHIEATSASVVRITTHAVARFRQRIRPNLSESEARHFLANECARAHRVKTLASGVELWRGPKPLRLRLRIHHGALITVLPSSDAWREPAC